MRAVASEPHELVGVRLPVSMLREIDALARSLHGTRTTAVRYVLSIGLADALQRVGGTAK